VLVTGNRRENWQREPVNTEIYRVALADGAIQELTKRNGPDRGAVVSPDGKSIAYVSFEDQYLGYQNAELNVMGLDGSNSRSLTASLDRTIDDVVWARDGRSLYVQYDDKAVTKVARVSPNGRVETVVEGLSGGSLDRPYTGGQFSIANNGTIAFTSGSTQRPTDISIARGGKVRQLTHLSDGLLNDKTLGGCETVEGQIRRPISATFARGSSRRRISIARRSTR
jgi:Tol biopolymer transport system component